MSSWKERKSYPEGVRCDEILNQINSYRLDENVLISPSMSGYARNIHHLEEDVNRCIYRVSAELLTALPSDIFILKAMPPCNGIWLEVQYHLFICLLPFSICLYSLFPVVEFLLALFRSEIYFPVHTLFSSNQEKLIAERRIPVLQSQLEEYKSILCQLQAQKYKLQTEVL